MAEVNGEEDNVYGEVWARYKYPLETREKSGDSTDVKIQPITGYRITIDVICVI